MRKKKTSGAAGRSPMEVFEQYLEQNKSDHYGFEEKRSYVVSSGSLKLDIEMGGGIGPGIIRASGVTEGGKTSCALSFARNFQKMDKAAVVYIKAEGRLSDEMLERSGINRDPSLFRVYASNVFESVIGLMRTLIRDNDDGWKFMFIIDSMDALVPRADLERPPEEANKVAGGALLAADFLRKMALGLTTRGHICYMISQVRSKVSINPYERSDARITNASGGNALLHYSDWILEFQERYRKHLITSEPNQKGDILGHQCDILFRKTPNEKTGRIVSYPICYGRKGGKSIWVEEEVVDLVLEWGMAEKKGAWISFTDEKIEELKNAGLELKKQHQGLDNFRIYFEENQDVLDYFYKEFLETLKKS